MHAQLAAVSALFVATPWSLDVAGLHRIHPDDTGPQMLDHSQAPENVTRPDRGGKPVRRVVRYLQRVVFGLEWNASDDGPEDFFSRDPRGVVGFEYRRLDEITVSQFFRRRPTASRNQLRFFASDVDVPHHLFQMLFADKRTHFGLALHRIAKADPRRHLLHTADELLEKLLLLEVERACGP